MRQYLLIASFAIAASLHAQSSSIRSFAEWNAQTKLEPVARHPQMPVPTDIEDALRQMADQAAIIFVGEVSSIHHRQGAVEICWQVEDAVRGVTADTTYVQHEWAGLWADGVPRYQVGQRSLVMLHAPSAAGFSSPVSGQDGVLPAHGDAVNGTVDLRWINTHIARAQRNLNGGVISVARMQAKVQLRVQFGEETQQDIVEQTGNIDRSVVLGMLRTWAREGNVQ